MRKRPKTEILDDGAPNLIVHDSAMRMCSCEINSYEPGNFQAYLGGQSHHVPDTCRRNQQVSRLFRKWHATDGKMYICSVTEKTAPMLREAVIQDIEINWNLEGKKT